MGESGAFRPSRYIAVVVVLALHLAAIALLLTASRATGVAVATNPPLQLVFLPPTKAPKMLADSARPTHMRADVGITVAPPALDGLSPAAPATQADGSGAGVNWVAEAHRALKAMEIRRVQNVQHAALGLSPWDGWLPERQQLADNRIRTSSGDWVVWINSSCYQIATWHERVPLQDTPEPQTICVDLRGTPPGGPIDQANEEPVSQP